MSPSNIEVELRCGNLAAEILLVDGTFKVVAKGSSPLKAHVTPGLYSAKVKVGTNVTERLIRLAPGQVPNFLVELESPDVESPIPPVLNAISHLTVAATTQSELPCGIFVCVSGSEGRAINLSVVEHGGRVVCCFDKQSAQAVSEPYRVISQRVPEGRYALSFAPGSDTTCLSLPVVRGWCLAVFLTVRWKSEAPTIDDFTVLYKQLDQPTVLSAEDVNTFEAVRIAMRDRRGVVPRELLEQMIAGKFEKPMLGLYAAHILLFRIKRPLGPHRRTEDTYTDAADLLLLEEIVQNVSRVIGSSHADVVALRWGFEAQAHRRALKEDTRSWAEILKAIPSPPLLTASWDLLVECARAQDVAALDQFPAFEPAGDLVGGGAMWLTYKPAPTAIVPGPAEPTAVAPASTWATTLGQLVNRFKDVIAASALGPSVGLLRVEVEAKNIHTPADAAAALHRILRKANWDLLPTSLPFFNTTQQDLIAILARALRDPDTLKGINESWIELFLKARREPIATLAQALERLDWATVYSDYVRRIKDILAKRKEAPK